MVGSFSGAQRVSSPVLRFRCTAKTLSRQWSELSKFDPDHDIDILLPLKYRCCVAHVSLETLESWSGRRIKPRKDRRSLKVPELLKEMVSIVSYDERLGNPSLDQYEGGAAVTVVKYPNTILVKPLDTDREWAGVEMSLPSYSEWASQVWPRLCSCTSYSRFFRNTASKPCVYFRSKARYSWFESCRRTTIGPQSTI